MAPCSNVVDQETELSIAQVGPMSCTGVSHYYKAVDKFASLLVILLKVFLPIIAVLDSYVR